MCGGGEEAEFFTTEAPLALHKGLHRGTQRPLRRNKNVDFAFLLRGTEAEARLRREKDGGSPFGGGPP